MPFKCLRPEERSSSSSTPVSAAARDYYNERQSSVYNTPANASIQRDLTRHALELLQLELPTKDNIFFLLDMGAGSGLSTKAAQDWFKEREKMTAFILAFDISAPMLSLALQDEKHSLETQVCADVFCGNAAQKLPIRDEVFDIAIGISMLQWLQPKGLEICFSSLMKQLSGLRNTQAIFQVYPSGLAHVDTIEKVALSVGFDSVEMFVSFPHRTTAKKWFLCLDKRKSLPVEIQEKFVKKQQLCLFARRFERRCVLQWLGKRRKCTNEIREQVGKQHVQAAWHIWRKYQRSIANDEAATTSSKRPEVAHRKALQSLELYSSDKAIGRALQMHFEERAGKISLAFLRQHAAEVIDVLHTAYTESRKVELRNEPRI